MKRIVLLSTLFTLLLTTGCRPVRDGSGHDGQVEVAFALSVAQPNVAKAAPTPMPKNAVMRITVFAEGQTTTPLASELFVITDDAGTAGPADPMRRIMLKSGTYDFYFTSGDQPVPGLIDVEVGTEVYASGKQTVAVEPDADGKCKIATSLQRVHAMLDVVLYYQSDQGVISTLILKEPVSLFNLSRTGKLDPLIPQVVELATRDHTVLVPTANFAAVEAPEGVGTKGLTTASADAHRGAVLLPGDLANLKVDVPVTINGLDKTYHADVAKVLLEPGKYYTLKIKIQLTGECEAIVELWKDQTSNPEMGELLPSPINPPAASDYVEINGLKWTKGNLIAKNGNECKVGAPGDYGVYFQFGSLVGWTGGSGNGTGTGSPALDKAVWPRSMGVSKPGYGWTNNIGTSAGDRNTVVDQYFFNYNVAPYATQGQDIRDFAVSFPGDVGAGNLGTGRYDKWGVGDACTYYLGAPWRLPTTDELIVLCNGQVGRGLSWDEVGGSWTTSPTDGGNFLENKLFFAAAGKRIEDASLSGAGSGCYYWSSSVLDATGGLSLYASSSVYPQDDRPRSMGYPVRCVSGTYVPPPPPPPHSVKINGLYWAEGNLVASNATAGKAGAGGCKIGAPTDGGLYFQFGSLIGYKGGAQANGGTGVGSNPYTGLGTQWWGGAGSYSWANDAMVWPAEQAGTQTTWTNTTNSGISTLSDYYFNYNATPWGTMGLNIRDFDLLSGTGTLGTGRYAVLGVGDACTYYLGAPWRLPTTGELLALRTAGSGGWTTNGGVTGRWLGTAPGTASSSVFFPASGCRDNSNGAFYTVTTSGYCWSSSVYTITNGYSLLSSSGSANPQSNNIRSYGLPVRCVASVP